MKLRSEARGIALTAEVPTPEIFGWPLPGDAAGRPLHFSGRRPAPGREAERLVHLPKFLHRGTFRGTVRMYERGTVQVIHLRVEGAHECSSHLSRDPVPGRSSSYTVGLSTAVEAAS